LHSSGRCFVRSVSLSSSSSPRHLRSTLFPYTTLFRSTTFDREAFRETLGAIREALAHRDMWLVACFILFWTFSPSFGPAFLYYQDRKSTRLNSSHGSISYAVFCLKKKK